MKKYIVVMILLGSVSIGISADALKELKLDKEDIKKYRYGQSFYPKDVTGASVYSRYASYINRKYGFKHFNVKVVASSELKRKYSAEKVLDDKVETTWVEGKKDAGIGELIKIIIQRKNNSTDYNLILEDLYIFSGIGMKDYFYLNNRLKSAICTMEYGKLKVSYRILFDDYYGFQFFDLSWYNNYTSPVLINTSEPWSMTIEIESVYPGTKYNDTCISEINISGIESEDGENKPFP